MNIAEPPYPIVVATAPPARRCTVMVLNFSHLQIKISKWSMCNGQRRTDGMPVCAGTPGDAPNRMFSHREIFFPIGDFGPGLPSPLKKSQPESAKGRRGSKALRLQRKSRTPTMRPALTYFLKRIFFMKIIRWRRA